MKIVKELFRKDLYLIILFLILSIINLIVFLLYNVFFEPFIYSIVLSFIFLIIFLIIDYFKIKKGHQKRNEMKLSAISDWNTFTYSNSLSDQDYHEIINSLGKELDKVINNSSIEKDNYIDYFTKWVHQIKTPIAVMKLKLSDDTDEHRSLKNELFKIEQYVDMVLQYLRLESSSTDLLIQEYSLDKILKESIKKYAPLFIEKKLKLELIESDMIITTDKKWFSSIIEQILSNAIKYTKKGTIKIYYEDGILKITDTGIGINSEDLPRIFEKGYTGNNGRLGESSSGLGLYLAKKASLLLSINLYVESQIEKGSTFIIDISEKIPQKTN